jgi:tetratricopeptide (TPR) repeat protein
MAALRPIVRRLAGALLAAVLAGCAAPGWRDRAALPPTAPDRVEVADVPWIPQDELYCGPAALATVLGWSGVTLSQAELAPAVFTPGRTGTLPPDLVSAARRHDRIAIPVADLPALVTELAAGHPVLVLQNLGLDWAPQWHYAVAVGYDRPAGELVLRSGREARRRVSLATFERTWARAGHWALAILPPDRIAASAGEATMLQAAASLEQSGRLAAAALAYETARGRWPASAGALIGLANARYGQGQLAAAEAALRAATALHPDSAAAWNNLAHVLAERGRHEPALAAVDRAIDIGGPFAETARTTRALILERSSAAASSPTPPPLALAAAAAPR